MKTLSSLFSAGLLSGLLALSSPLLQAGNDGCKEIGGAFTSVVVSEGCESPIEICTRGLLTGNFHAVYEFTMVTLEPAGDPEDPTKWVYTGTSVITLRSGEKLYSIDTGIMHMGDPTATPFVTTADIVSSTGKRSSGQFVAKGVLNFLTGEAVGSYEGEVCKEKKNAGPQG